MFRLKRLPKLLIVLYSILPLQSGCFEDSDSIIRPARSNLANLASKELLYQQVEGLDCTDETKQEQHDSDKFETNVIKRPHTQPSSSSAGEARELAATTSTKDDKIPTLRALVLGKQAENPRQRSVISTGGDKLERRVGPILVLLPLLLNLLRAILQLLRILEIILPPLFVILQVVRLLLRLLDPLFYLQLLLLVLNIASNIARAILRIILRRIRREEKEEKEEERETRVITLLDEERPLPTHPKKAKKKHKHKPEHDKRLGRRMPMETGIEFLHPTTYNQLLGDLELIAGHLSRSLTPPAAAELHLQNPMYHLHANWMDSNMLHYSPPNALFPTRLN